MHLVMQMGGRKRRLLLVDLVKNCHPLCKLKMFLFETNFEKSKVIKQTLF